MLELKKPKNAFELNEEKIDIMLKMILDGYALEAIAENFSIPSVTFYNICKRTEKLRPHCKRLRLALTKEKLEEMSILAGKGLTMQQIADYFNWDKDAFYDFMKQYPEMREALARGKAKTISFVSGKLIEKIREGDTQSIIFYLKTQGRWSTVEDDKEKDKDENISKQQKIGTNDPLEAAKIYQEIMLEG